MSACTAASSASPASVAASRWEDRLPGLAASGDRPAGPGWPAGLVTGELRSVPRRASTMRLVRARQSRAALGLGFLHHLHHLQLLVGEDLQVHRASPHLVLRPSKKTATGVPALARNGPPRSRRRRCCPGRPAPPAPPASSENSAGALDRWSAGILHQNQGGYPHLGNGSPIQLPHLGGSEQFHALASSGKFTG